MLEIHNGETKTGMKRRVRAVAGLLLVLTILLALASGANAAQVCQDCHGLHHATAQDPQQCGNTTTCGTACHAGKLDTLLHPSGAGTPVPDPFTTAGIAAACSTCHEPAGVAVSHPYRINTGPSTTSSYPDIDQVCGKCHGGGMDSTVSPPGSGIPYLTRNQLAVLATNIHMIDGLNTANCTSCHGTGSIPPVAGFVSHPTGTGTPGIGAAACRTCHLANGVLHRKAAINVQKVCGQCHGGDNGAGATTNGAPYISTASLSIIAPFMHVAANKPPVASHGPMARSLYTVSFPDTSTDPDGTVQSVTVNWGDGTITTQTPGSTFTHTYKRARTFRIYLSVWDGMASSQETFTVAVPQTFTISGTVTDGTAAIANVYLSLKKNGRTIKSTRSASNGSYSFRGVLPGDYTIRAYRFKYTFPAVTSVRVSAADVTQDITSLSAPPARR